MTDNDEAFDNLLKSALGRAPRELADPSAPAPHIDPGELAEHHRHQLSAEDAARVRGHLKQCAECSRLFLDFDVPPPVDPRDQAFDEQAGWQRLREE